MEIWIRAEMTCLGSVELGLVPDWIDNSQEPFKGQRHDPVRGRHQHPPQRHLHTTTTRNPQCNLGRAASPPLTAENNYATKSPLGQWDALRSPQKLPLSFRRSPPPCNTPIPRPIPLTIPNGILIQSSVLPQFTRRTDRQTDRPTDGIGDRPVPTLAYALY